MVDEALHTSSAAEFYTTTSVLAASSSACEELPMEADNNEQDQG